MSKYNLRSTKDYNLFSVSKTNRSVNAGHLRRLKVSMEEYGWIPAFPMLVHRTKRGLEIIDGQHRYFVAKDLGLPIWFVECDNGYDVAKINQPQSPWKILDYAESFTKRGVGDYAEVVEFSEKYNMTIGDSAAILAGTVSFGNVKEVWTNGTYKIRDREHAERVAYLYGHMRSISRDVADRAMRLALIAVARVDGVDFPRLIRNAEAMPERLVKYATREAALSMLEEVYNFRARGPKFPLKVAAENAMHERNASIAKK